MEKETYFGRPITTWEKKERDERKLKRERITEGHIKKLNKKFGLNESTTLTYTHFDKLLDNFYPFTEEEKEQNYEQWKLLCNPDTSPIYEVMVAYLIKLEKIYKKSSQRASFHSRGFGFPTDFLNKKAICYVLRYIDYNELTYQEQLRLPQWQKKRLEIMQRDDFSCDQCGDDQNILNVHHKQYIEGRTPWDYPNEDLITLCEPCHSLIELLKNI